MFSKIHRSILTLMLLTTGLLLGNAGYAAVAFPGPLPLGFTNPDIKASGLTLTYDYLNIATANLLTLTATGASGSFLDSSNVNHTINNLNYNLSAVLDDTANNQLLSGTLSISGDVPDYSLTGANLLAASLTDFGTSWPSTGTSQVGTFQFLGNVTSSAGALGFGPTVIVNFLSTNLNPGFFGQTDFSGTGNADNSTPTAVPEPGTLILLAAGGLALGGMRRRYPTA